MKMPNTWKAALAPALLCLAAACRFGTSTGEPPRPAGVPQDAVWVGGPDGGVFVKLEKADGEPGTVRAAIYADHTGAILYQGALRLEPPAPQLPELGDPKLFNGWDGQRLLLRDGRELRVAR